MHCPVLLKTLNWHLRLNQSLLFHCSWSSKVTSVQSENSLHKSKNKSSLITARDWGIRNLTCLGGELFVPISFSPCLTFPSTWRSQVARLSTFPRQIMTKLQYMPMLFWLPRCPCHEEPQGIVCYTQDSAAFGGFSRNGGWGPCALLPPTPSSLQHV